jgi:hypothetical protein
MGGGKVWVSGGEQCARVRGLGSGERVEGTYVGWAEVVRLWARAGSRAKLEYEGTQEA